MRATARSPPVRLPPQNPARPSLIAAPILSEPAISRLLRTRWDAPEIPGGNRAVGAPACAYFAHLAGCWQFFKALEPAISFTDAVVVHRQDVGSRQRVDQEHFYGPPANTPQ